MKFVIDIWVHLSQYSQGRKEDGFNWYFTKHELGHFPTVESAGFKAIKGTKLRSNYWDEAWVPRIVQELADTGKSTVVMQNVPKNITGSSNLFCINHADLSIVDDYLHVEIDYRALAAMGPFLADLWLFNDVFNDIAARAGVQLQGVQVNSAKAFVSRHTSWRILWMDQLQPMQRVELYIKFLDSADHAFARACKQLLTKYGMSDEMPTGPWRQQKRMYKAVNQLPPECKQALRTYLGVPT